MPFLIQGHITILQRIIGYNDLDTSFDSVGERIKRSIIGTAHIVCKAYCTSHRVRESQLDELVLFEIQGLRDHIIAEADKYDNIVREWNRKKPLYDQQIIQHETKISGLNREIEGLVIDRMNDRSRRDEPCGLVYL